MNADGSNKQRLTTNSANDTHPVWSPDGSKIAFMTDRTHDYKIYVMNADGSNRKMLTTDHVATNINDVTPSWSPTGSKIAFASNRDFMEEDESIELYTMDRAGGNMKRLTEDSFTDDTPCWAPRKKGIDVSEDSIVIPSKSEFAKSLTVKEVTSEVRNAVVKIETEHGTGSGFIIDPNGLIMTNNHVIVDAEEITVYLDNSESYEATLRNRDLIADIAVIEIEVENLPHIPFGDAGMLDLGEQVVVLGFPMDSESLSPSSGIVSAVDFDSGRGITWVKTDSAIVADLY